MMSKDNSWKNEPGESLEQLEERLAREIAEIIQTGGTCTTYVDDPNSLLKWEIHPGFYLAYSIRHVYKNPIFLTSAT